MQNSLEQLKTSLKEMFQFQNNDLNFGIYKIYKLKQKEIEKFIDDNLESIVKTELQNVSNLEEKSSLLELELFLKGFNQEKLLEDINSNYEKIDGFINLGGNGNTEKLKEILKSQRVGSIEGDLENKIYNYILNFFELYYSEGDFGYNTRSLNTYKVEYDENYNGSDIMFHWKHKGSYYIKSANGFNSVKFELQNKNIEFLLETNDESEGEELSQNNNRETEFKHYKFNRIENIGNDTFKVIFNLSKISTSKEEIYKAIFKEILNIEIDESFLFDKDKKAIFKSLDKDFGKIQDGNIKGFGQLKIKKDDLVKKYDTNLEAKERLKKSFDDLDSKNEIENTIITLWSLDNKLNSFYIGNDSDFFIHKYLKRFLTQEKEKFIKNNILGDLSSILNSKIDNTTIVIAKTFNEISSKIIEFLSAIEEFQKSMFEAKKKVLVSEYCITLDKIQESFYSEILENKAQIEEWKNLGFISDEKVLNLEYLKANFTLNIDTKFFSKDFKDRLLNTFDDLENSTNGILINSENFQALNVLKNKYRGKVKCIYIDPPYNTGGDGFVYKDSFRHSSWLSMMENRLTLAREFLSNDGVIFVSIDDNEQDNLKKLMDQVFGSENFVANFIWKSKSGGANDSKYIANDNEYILCFGKNINKLSFNDDKNATVSTSYNCKDENGKYALDRLDKQSIRYSKTLDYEIIGPDGKTYHPKHKDINNPNATWRWGKKTVENRYQELVFKDGNIYTKNYEKEGSIVRSLLIEERFGRTRTGKTDLFKFFNYNIFSSPKPLNLLKFLFEVSTNLNSIILDFFSGSGTTQQAVIELNREEKENLKKDIKKASEEGNNELLEVLEEKYKNAGKRKYIGVEMGEYFDTVTKPRVQKVIYSSNWKNGLPQDNKGVSQIMKYQVLEQYEDMLDKLEIDTENFPQGLDLKYLYKKEEIKLKSTLNLRKPFENNYIYGKAKKESKIDLVETYNYAKGNNIESIKTFEINKKYYKAIKTGNILQIWRDIEPNENDLENIKEIISKYNDIEVLELNVEIYSLERNKFGILEINGKNYDIEIIDESLFNE